MTERYPLPMLTAAECIHFKVFLRRRIRHTVHGSSQQRKKQRCSPNIWLARKSSKPHSCRRYKTPPCQPLFRPVWRDATPHRVNTSPAKAKSRLARFSPDLADTGRRYENKQEKAEGLHSNPSAAHSGRQRRPHKALRDFCKPNRKPPFRGCCLKSLACLGVADFKQKMQQKGGILNAHTEG